MRHQICSRLICFLYFICPESPWAAGTGEIGWLGGEGVAQERERWRGKKRRAGNQGLCGAGLAGRHTDRQTDGQRGTRRCEVDKD